MADPSTNRDELRLALALNGGVSLAVWMGGVVQELDDLRCADLGTNLGSQVIYEKVLEALGLRVRIDIASATSAGGMNGPLLAVAVAGGTRITRLRDLWMGLADFSQLLRSSAESEPPSLLKGDDFVLTNVEKQLSAQFNSTDLVGSGARFRLILTGTDIQGVSIDAITDSYGSSLPRIEHRLQFRFAADIGGAPTPRGWLPLANTSLSQIGRAARTSSSFPFAFEPSRVEQAEFERGLWTRRGGPLELKTGTRRWAIDGGVLDNSPIQPMLSEVWATPTAEVPQRRCVVFVTPYSTESVVDPPPEATLSSVLGATFMVPREAPYVDDIARLDEQVRRQRQAMVSDGILLGLSEDDLTALANGVMPEAERTRVRRAIQRSAARAGVPVTDELIDAWSGEPTLVAQVAPAPGAWLWNEDHVRASALRWRARLAQARRALPVGADGARAAIRAAEQAIQAAVILARDSAPAVPTATPAERAVLSGEGAVADDLARLGAAAAGAAAGTWQTAMAVVAAQIGLARAPLQSSGPTAEAAAALLGALDVTAERLVQVEAVIEAFSNPSILDAPPGVEIEFLRMSTSPLDELPLVSEGEPPSSFEYLYGAQLGHFGGFVRATWRAHDWILGRLDGASAAMQLLLNHQRIAEAGLDNDRLAALYTACGGVGAVPAGQDAPLPDEIAIWRRTFAALVRDQILAEELPQLQQAFVDEGEGWSSSTPAPQGEITPANASERFAAYLGTIAARGGTKQVTTEEFSSPRGSRLIADAAVVASSVLGSRTTGFPAFVGVVSGSARGLVRAASFAVHRATGGRLERTLFITATGAAGAALAWSLARSTSTGPIVSVPTADGTSATLRITTGMGTSPFREAVVAASLTILTVAIILAIRPFASRAWSIVYGASTAALLTLLVGWLWTGKVQASCSTATLCGGLGSTTFLWVVVGLVALGVSIGWVATSGVRETGQWIASFVTLVLIGLLTWAIVKPAHWMHSWAHWLRHADGLHAVSAHGIYIVVIVLVALLAAPWAYSKVGT
jgi:predicted acylesterase/phospholipase RssA